MAAYCYSREAEVITRRFPMGEAPTRVKHRGKWYSRDISAEWRRGRNTTAANWPMHSDAMGVNPDQIPEAIAADKRLGVPVEYDRHTGCAIYPDASTRRKHCEAHGVYDLNGGYSDPQRRRIDDAE